MRKLLTIAAFVAAVAAAMLAFAPLGGPLGELAHRMYELYGAQGASAVTSAVAVLLGLDLAALLIVAAVSFAGGVGLPSGLPHVFFALFVPLTLGAAQVRFFELAQETGDLAETFGTYNFIAMFVLSLAVAQLGVYASRRRYEARRHAADRNQAA